MQLVTILMEIFVHERLDIKVIDKSDIQINPHTVVRGPRKILGILNRFLICCSIHIESNVLKGNNRSRLS